MMAAKTDDMSVQSIGRDTAVCFQLASNVKLQFVKARHGNFSTILDKLFNFESLADLSPFNSKESLVTQENYWFNAYLL